MVNRLKSLVSKKKKRFQEDGFDLDLSYISPRIIAMGFPAERIEGFYRNHIDEVSRFFEMKHKGHYKIYHLCNERDFNEYRFSGPVVRYPFSDHNAPQFEQILDLSQDVMQFLKQNPKNVVAINCKAGKGRTGVMACACLMGLQEARNAEEALRIYAEKRTRNGQGVTIPSQRRYVQYYSHLLSSKLKYEPTPLRLTSIRIEGLSNQLHGVQYFELSISTYDNRFPVTHIHDPAAAEAFYHPQKDSATVVNANAPGTADNNPDHVCHRHSGVATYRIPCSVQHEENGSYLIRLDEPITVFEDFRIKVKAKGGVFTKKIIQCWLNTFFVLLDDDATINTSTASVSSSSTTADGCIFMSDSNSGSGSSSDCSASSASSVSSSVRHSPPGVKEELEEEYIDEGLSTFASSFTSLHSSSPTALATCHFADPVVIMQRSSKSGASVPFTSIPKKVQKSYPSANILTPSLPIQTVNPLSVWVIELSESELDSTIKSKGKKAEDFKVLFEFIREAPYIRSSPSHSNVCFLTPTTSCSVQRVVAMDLEGAEEEQIDGTVSLPVTSFQHPHPFHAERTANQTDVLVS